MDGFIFVNIRPT